MTDYIATRWYRAPEICAQHEYYNEKIDIWSLGCILYEMLTKKSFIQGPDNDLILLHNLFLTHPTVTEDDFTFLQKYSNVNLACTRPKKGFKQTSWKGRVSEMFVPLLERMLTINFNKRSSANELLSLFNDQNNSIKNCQQLYPAINNIVNLSIVNDKTRQVGILLGIELYNHRESIDWYKHRIFFASIDMWDRFLVYMRKEKDFETLNVVEIKLYYITIYYLAMKYFQIMTVPISFRSLLDIFVKLKQFPSFGKEYIQMAEDFEIYLVRDIFQYKIYRATIYEMEKDLSEERIKEMMIYYSRGEGNFGVKEFYKYFCDKMI